MVICSKVSLPIGLIETSNLWDAKCKDTIQVTYMIMKKVTRKEYTDFLIEEGVDWDDKALTSEYRFYLVSTD